MATINVRANDTNYTILTNDKSGTYVTPNAYITINVSGSATYLFLYSSPSYGRNMGGKFLKVYYNGVLFAGPKWVVATFDSTEGTPTYASQNVESGLAPSNPGSPTRTGYTFNGWSPALTNMYNNVSYQAIWVTG